MDECFLDLWAVVDTAQQDRLIAERDTSVGEACEAVTDFGGEFFRVVRVDGNEKWVVLFKHFA